MPSKPVVVRPLILFLALLPRAHAAQSAPQPPTAPAAARGGLPPIACVEAVRDARLARDRGDAPAARQKFEAAVELPGCELPALSGLLRLLREGFGSSGSAESVSTVRDRLAARLSDPSTELPGGFLTQLERIGAATTDRDGDQALLSAVQKRDTGAAAAHVELPLPERVEMLEVMANLDDRLGQAEASRDALGRLLVLAPSDAVRWRALMSDLAKQRWPGAAELLATMVPNPEAPEALRYFYVTTLAHLGRYDEMLHQLESLTPPPSPPAVAGAPGDAPESEEAVRLRSGPGLEPSGFVTLLLDSAWALRDAGRDAEAAGLFRRVLTVDPKQQEAQAALLHLYGTTEERAAAAAATAVRRQTESDPAKLFEEGSDLLGAGDAAGALALLARAAPELGGSAYAEPAWYNLGTAAYKLEHWEEAAHAFEQAIAVNPARVESHFKRGVALFHLVRCKEAVAVLRHVLELQPDKRDAHHYLAGCYISLGDTAAAARESELFAKPH